MQDGDGNFYGTAPESGTYDAGTVFKVTPAGSLTTMYSFCPWTGCADGSTPYGGLVRGRDGNFYGTTVWGGASDNCGGYGCGTVFKITPEGGLTTVHSFDGSDGDTPYSTLMQARDGNFYGTNYTFLVRMTPGGTVTTLNGEGNAENGCVDQLVQAADGNFYGTTVYGGANTSGTVFKMNPSGTVITLHVFDGSDGNEPRAGLVQAGTGCYTGQPPPAEATATERSSASACLIHAQPAVRELTRSRGGQSNSKFCPGEKRAYYVPTIRAFR